MYRLFQLNVRPLDWTSTNNPTINVSFKKKQHQKLLTKK